MTKFKRVYELRIQYPYPRGGRTDRPEAGEYLVIKLPTTIEFNIERHEYSSAANASIKIYNLSHNTRQMLYRDRLNFFTPGEEVTMTKFPQYVQLYGGYEDEPLSLIFRGLLWVGRSYRRNADFITELECQDPGTGLYMLYGSYSYDKTVWKSDIIKNLLQSMGIIDFYISPYFNKTVAKRGQVVHGNIFDNLKQIVESEVDKKTGSTGRLFWDLGKAFIMGPNEFPNDAILTLIDANTGLLNVPIKNDTSIEAQLIFTPQLQINQLIQLQSSEGGVNQDFNGTYGIVGIRHQGIISSTHDAPTITVVSLEIVKTNLKQVTEVTK